MKNLAFITLAVLSLTGCATSKDYQLYAETQQKIAQANAMAETARYAALAEIAKSGDTASRVAAVMSLNMGSGQGVKAPQQVNPPKSFGDTALQWTSVLLPSLTQVYGINANRQIAITQSNNQAAVAKSTNETFATMNGNMATSNTAIANAGFTAVTNVANSGLTATTNVANTGIAQVGTTAANGLTAATNISTSANTAITNVSNAANTSLQTLSNQIPNLQPNVTTTTTTTTTNNTTNNTTPTTP